MKRKIGFFLMLLLAGACSPRFNVGTDQDPNADFSKYLTFAPDRRELFTRRSNALLNSDLTKKRIHATITEVLQAKGYEAVEKQADLIFSFQTEVRNRQDVQQVNNPPMWGYWRFWNDPAFRQTYVRNYEETTLIIDIKDARTLELIWQGWVIGELKYTAEDWAKKIDQTVREAMNAFPARTSGS